MITFGPIQSRRLGKSLGINNIISPKVCSYGCVYCQVGNTKKKILERDTFFQPKAIYSEVKEHLLKLQKADFPDYLTFVSNGEPTLDVNLGKSIELLKKLNIPVAVITNASLLYNEKVREDLYLADWVSLKIDAGDKSIWQTINRPYSELNFENLVSSYNIFSTTYKGSLRTETMLVKGINDTLENISKVSDIISTINPGKAFLSVPTKPPADNTVQPSDSEMLSLAWQIFIDKNINTEFLTDLEGTDNGYTGNIYNDILNITAVHPLREDSIHKLLQNNNANAQVITSLIKQRLIKTVKYNGEKYFLREYHQNI